MSRNIVIILLYVFFMLLLVNCKEPSSGNTNSTKKDRDTLVYLNHSDTARYVGINSCKLCHQSIYNSFIKTGMGKSFDVATKQKSSANFHTSVIYDKQGDYYYKAYWQNDSLFFLEYRLSGKDTVYKRIEHVNYIIGSGQHTNSHIQSVNGYLNQMPMTFYTQKQQWDLPPGFENGHNSRFMRKIGLECMSCHNSYPEFVMGSENKYTSVPEGINCERCHGPGSIHVAQRSTGAKIDTSRYVDYSIVNPSKLSIDQQFDVCQRCHLQGNAVLKPEKSFYNFKPGMKLSDIMTVFLPKYKNADDEFVMASHADRLKQSQCFIKSYEKSKHTTSLKPYKEALTCVTCHNPHVSVRETNKEVFNDACKNCHHTNGKSTLMCTDKQVIQGKKNNCVSCHMPPSSSIDIPHVTVHDHYIRKPITAKDKIKLKEFIGLYAVNEKQPDALTKAKAYINQYDKFEQQAYYLDSAKKYLRDMPINELEKNIETLIHLYFIKQAYTQILNYVNTIGEKNLMETVLVKQSYTNDHAWTSYRIAESYNNTNQISLAIKWLEHAVKLAPFNLEFKNKLGSSYVTNNQLKEAEKQFNDIINEHPKTISAYTNLGYINMIQGNVALAQKQYEVGLKLDPDYEPLLLNITQLYLHQKNYKQARLLLEKIIKKNPSNQQAKGVLEKLKKLT